MKVYLDSCCLNRPQDDQSQPRIRIETEAILRTLDKIQAGEWTGIQSRIHVLENAAYLDPAKRAATAQTLRLMQDEVSLTEAVIERAEAISALGIKQLDALHVASAEFSQADVMLTTDDRLLRAAQRNTSKIFIRVPNPTQWVSEVLLQWTPVR